MYGVSTNLNLSFLIGRPLTMVGLGEFQVQFHFHPEGCVSVEGDWELLGPDSVSIDRSMKNAERAAYRLHRLLGQEVAAFDVDPPRSFSLKFSNGLVLRVFDNSKQYESFSIQPGDIYV